MSSFEETYEENRQLVRMFLMRLCGNESLAEELTQETFLRAMRHWKEFRGESSVSTWLCGIAKRLYADVCRKPTALSLAQQAETADARYDITDALIDSDRMMTAHRLLHALPEPYREVFMLRTFGELSHQQIGSLFGKSDAWARVTYYRARQMLAHSMKEEMNDAE